MALGRLVRGYRSIAAGCVSLALSALSTPAFAQQDLPDNSGTLLQPQLRTPETVLLFAGYDVWRDSGTNYGGVQWSPGGLDRDGVAFRVLGSANRERFESPGATYRTDIFRSSLLVGYRLSSGTFELKAFAGPDLEYRRFKPDLAAQPLRGLHAGGRALAEIWWQPTAETMLAGSASISSVASAWSGRIAGGVRVFDRFWVGPELLASGDDFSKQYRAGAHITGLQTVLFEDAPPLEWSVAAGVVHDSFSRTGLYGRISVLTKR